MNILYILKLKRGKNIVTILNNYTLNTFLNHKQLLWNLCTFSAKLFEPSIVILVFLAVSLLRPVQRAQHIFGTHPSSEANIPKPPHSGNSPNHMKYINSFSFHERWLTNICFLTSNNEITPKHNLIFFPFFSAFY